jgi:dTDP-glucose 4,6-dehydratase
MSSWLVIGASSFSGSHFCRHLRERGESVEVASLRDSLPHFAAYNYVANFAALNVVAPSWKYADDYLRTNVLYQEWFWRELADLKIPYLHVSTPEVYGSTSGWVSEDAPFNPSTPYAVSRAAAEMLLRCYHKQYGLPVAYTRACNVYGPGQQLYRLIPKLIWHIKHGKRFPLEGGGKSARAFLHVDDMCTGYYLAATQGEPGQAYHVTSYDFTSISNVVALVCGAMKVNPADVIEETPERPGKDAFYCLRYDKIRKLGWQPTVGLPAGIRNVIDWMEGEWETLKDQPTDYEFKP